MQQKLLHERNITLAIQQTHDVCAYAVLNWTETIHCINATLTREPSLVVITSGVTDGGGRGARAALPGRLHVKNGSLLTCTWYSFDFSRFWFLASF